MTADWYKNVSRNLDKLQLSCEQWMEEFRKPSACYSGGVKESTRITSTLHFPVSDTQGRLCRLGKEEF